MEKSIEDLSRYRYETSVEALEDAKLMHEKGRYKNALNRAYYSIFHGIRSVNALEKYDSSKHSGVIAFFNQRYVKTGTFPKDLSKIIRLSSESREKADYLDFFIASKSESEKQIRRAEEFNTYIREFLMQKRII